MSKLNSATVKLAVAALFGAGLATAVVHAATPTPQAPARMAVETQEEYIQKLRSIRSDLNHVKEEMNAIQMEDKGKYRHAALEHVDRAVDQINNEVVAVEGKK